MAQDKRHYDVEALHAEYKTTFGILMKVLMIGVGGALLYFMVYIVYLGGWSHTKSEAYAKNFNERYPQDYKGLKLPEFGGPAAPEPAHHGAAEAAHAAPAAHAEGAAEAAHEPAAAATAVTETTAVTPTEVTPEAAPAEAH